MWGTEQASRRLNASGPKIHSDERFRQERRGWCDDMCIWWGGRYQEAGRGGGSDQQTPDLMRSWWLWWNVLIISVPEWQHHLRLRLVGLSSAGHRVADTRAGQRIHRLHDDEGPLLQGGYRQMPVIRHRLQVGAVTGPHGVSHLQDPHFVVPHLEGVEREEEEGIITKLHVVRKLWHWGVLIILLKRPNITCEAV